MGNPVKEILNSVNGLKQSLDGVKQSVNGMKETVDSAKRNIQDTMGQAKGRASGIKAGMSRMKESVRETKDVVMEAKQSITGLPASGLPAAESSAIRPLGAEPLIAGPSASESSVAGRLASATGGTPSVSGPLAAEVPGKNAPHALSEWPEPVREGNGFVMREDGVLIGEVTYLPLDGIGTWVIDYTYVAPRYRGAGIARLLIDRVVTEARGQGKQILPACSYALARFHEEPRYGDLWRR